jgi:hypothetical protein
MIQIHIIKRLVAGRLVPKRNIPEWDSFKPMGTDGKWQRESSKTGAGVGLQHSDVT